MSWLRRPKVSADVGAGFIALESTAHQSAIESSAGSGKQTQQVAAEFVIHAETSGAVVLAWNNRNVGFAPPEQHESLRAQATMAAAGRARLVVSGEVFREAGTWRVWAGPPPRPGGLVTPTDSVAPKAPNIAGIPIQRTE